ncbi:epimerase [Streptosporangiaceae bacterium NEAU-GS5]|nr:epimerase [Streptosporangiaceae bacterium NEAU-GS5]
MNVLLYGATGMVGQGVLRECLLDPGVEGVTVVGRNSTGETHPKLRESVQLDVGEVPPGDYDACFFCLGVSSFRMSEADYKRITYDLTLQVAAQLKDLTFIYVSGAGTDTNGRAMWARVKGRTEDALLALPLRAYMFRPGYIQPLHGITSRTRLYRVLYRIGNPIFPLVRRIVPSTTTEQIGRAMLAVARDGFPQHVLGTREINSL